MGEQIALDFGQSITKRNRAATKNVDQITLFSTWIPNIDVAIHSGKEAVATINASSDQVDQAVTWLKKMVSALRPVSGKRFVFPARELHKLGWVRPPANITLDSNARAIACAQHAKELGLKPLQVMFYRNRISAQSPRGWPAGFRVRDAGWETINSCLELGLPLDIEDKASKPLLAKLDKKGITTVEGRLTGSSVTLTTPRPQMLEKLELPGLSFVGDPGDGVYRMPLLLAGELTKHDTIHLTEEATKAIKKVSKPAKPLILDDTFPWNLWDFQAKDAGSGLRILETTGGVLFSGEMGTGKALWDEETVLTPSGWRKVNTIKTGEHFVGSDGLPTRVLGVFPQGARHLFRVALDDGNSVVVDGDHLWAISSDHLPDEVLPTSDIAELLDRNIRVFLPTIKPTFFAYNKHSHHLGSIEDRKEFLNKKFADSSSGVMPLKIAHKVQDIAWSLGGTAFIDPIKDDLVAVKVVLPEESTPVRREIISISYAGVGTATCFKVAAEDSLFVAANYMLTHNTTIGLGVAHHMDLFPLLVVAPLSAFSTWERQLNEMGKSTYLCVGSASQNWSDLQEKDFDAVVISFDRLGTFDEVLRQKHFAGIIADELQRVRNPGSRRSRAIRAFASAVPYRIGLSGTPLVNGLPDLLSQGAFLIPSEWPARASSKHLEDVYPGDPVTAVTQHLGSIMVRRKMSDVGKPMPKRIDRRIYVQITDDQRKALAELEERARKAKEEGEFDGADGKFNALVKLGQMRKIISNPVAEGVGSVAPKVKAAIETADAFVKEGRFGVIFANDMPSYYAIEEGLNKRGIRTGGISGAVSPEDRIKVEKRFHAGEIDVVMCTAAGAESWSASPRGTWVLLTRYPWVPSEAAQSESRVYRLNSDLNGPAIEIIYLHAVDGDGPTIDARMLEILNMKRELFAKVIDLEEFTDTTDDSVSISDMLYMLTGEEKPSLAQMEKDAREKAAESQKRKEHAKNSLHRKKIDKKASSNGSKV